jgi:hypothetical protein
LTPALKPKGVPDEWIANVAKFEGGTTPAAYTNGRWTPLVTDTRLPGSMTAQDEVLAFNGPYG